MGSSPATDGPLAGVRVLDLSRLLPGGVMTQLLGDLGAEVIKVERPGSGDEMRSVEPRVGHTSAAHAFVDRNKLSVALDLREGEDREAVLSIAATCDIAVESFRPGVADRFGVGYDDLAEVNPAIVYCSLSGYGSTGPRADAPGHDLNFCSYAGINGFHGPPDRPAQFSGAQIADYSAGALGAVGVLAALHSARESGKGRRIEVPLLEAAAWAVGIHLSSFLAGGPDGPISNSTNGAFPCYRLYECADGEYLSVGALEPKFWRNLITAVDRPDLEDRQFDPDATAELIAVFRGRPRVAWLTLLEHADACIAPVNRLAEAVDDEQLRARGAFVKVDGLGEVEQLRCPIFEPDRPEVAYRPARDRVGRDTEAVLKRCLGTAARPS